MQFNHVAAARPLVQAVHVLGDERKLWHALFQFHQRKVSGVRLRLRDELPPPRIPLPHQARIAPKRFGRRQIFRAISRPQPRQRVAERRDATLRRNARTRQRDHAPGSAERCGQFCRNLGLHRHAKMRHNPTREKNSGTPRIPRFNRNNVPAPAPSVSLFCPPAQMTYRSV